MTVPQPVTPVKLILAMLWLDTSSRDRAIERVVECWRAIDYAGPDRPFDMTDYYGVEMGPRLSRRLISFENLIMPETIREAKLRTNELELEFSRDGHRSVNLDIGYLDHNKVVLASVKFAGQKIHLGDGIYADMIARYGNGRYQPFEWTFPDFKDGRYDDELNAIRDNYLRQLRAARAAQGHSTR